MWWLAALVALGVPARAVAESVGDTLHVPLLLSAPPDSLRLGQTFEIVGSIPVAGLHGLSLLSPERALAPFELRDWQRGLDRGDTAQVTLTFQAFDVGALVLPPLAISGETPDGRLCVAHAESLAVDVVSIVPEDATEIRDIHEAVAPEAPRPRWPWIAAAAVLCALALFWLVRRARRRGGVLERVTAARPAHEIALESLGVLDPTRLAPGAWKAYYTELTSILRAYLARRFGVDALDMTTSETLRAVEHLELGDAARTALRTVLRAADAVKFAKGEPADGVPLRHLEDARRFVRLTVPVAPAAPSGRPVVAAGEGRS
jgi:hypothetical protein